MIYRRIAGLEERVVSSQAQPSETQTAQPRTPCIFKTCALLLRKFLSMLKWLRERLGLVLEHDPRSLQAFTGIVVSMDPGPAPAKLPSVRMNIILDTGNAQGHDNRHPRTTLRIGLLDTGASFNLISHRAHEALNRPIRPCQASVQSIAGDTEMCGSTIIEWRFLPDDERLVGSSGVYCAKFFILPESPRPVFDCILGWPWLAENWSDVGKLFDAKAMGLMQ